MREHITHSRNETVRLGQRLAKTLKAGDVVALIGELGAGKTMMTKGIAKGLGVKDYRYVNSPSFVIIKEYKGKVPLYHFDVFRLNHPGDLDSVGWEEYFYGTGVSVVEWADKIKKLLPKRHIEIRIDVLDEDKRKIVIGNR